MRATLILASLTSLLISLTAGTARAQGTALDPALARQYFREAEAACGRDAGRLWGANVCGPILFVDPVTRAMVGNRGDAEGLLERKGEVFVGRLPDRQPVANAAVTLGGVKWAMIVWQFMTSDRFQRVKLMIHESFHRIQGELGLTVAGAGNVHLDSREGRVWLQLEWRALGRAVASRGAARRRAIEDALTFRRHRRSLFPNAESSERALEVHEGLAEYTGFKLGAADEAELFDRLSKHLDGGANYPSFVGSFAYVSGPAYGVLLDVSGAGWLKGLSQRSDLGELLQRVHGIRLPPDSKARAEKRASLYGGDELIKAEARREAERKRRIDEYRAKLVNGPTLLIPLTDKRRVTLNTDNIIPLEGAGIVYARARVTDEWGVLDVSNGALMIQGPGGRIVKVYVPAPPDLQARPLRGDGWVLQIEPGWVTAPGERKGDFVLRRAGQ